MKTNRAWVYAPDAEALSERWRQLIRAERVEKQRLMKETRDRTVDRIPTASPARALIEETCPTPGLERVGFRSFDRQHLIADERVVDFMRPELWHITGEQQVFLVTQFREPLTNGPGAVFSALVPDMHHFSGRGGRVIPLFRDRDAQSVNVALRLRTLMRSHLGIPIAETDMLAYVAGAIAHAGYTATFEDDLQQPGVRVPLTSDPSLWVQAVNLGKRVIWLHTYGERFADAAEGRPPGQPKDHRPAVVGTVGPRFEDMPTEYRYADGALHIGRARIEPVSEAAAEYRVSGMRVIKHWFDYRKRKPSGKRTSDLDNIVPERWTVAMTEELRNLVAVIEGCVELEGQQMDLLARILAGPLLTVDDLTDAGVLPVPPQAKRLNVDRDTNTLF